MFIPNAESMLINFSDAIPSLMNLVTASAYVSGFYMVAKNVASLRGAAFISSPGQGQVSVFDVLKKIFIGTMLIYLPSTVDMGTTTLWAQTSPLAYITDFSDAYAEFFNLVNKIMLLIGTISVIRGLYQMAHGQADQSGSTPFQKGSAFFIAGICLINMPTFITTILNTLGI
jgi:hypothetical protein